MHHAHSRTALNSRGRLWATENAVAAPLSLRHLPERFGAGPEIMNLNQRGRNSPSSESRAALESSSPGACLPLLPVVRYPVGSGEVFLLAGSR